MLRRRGIQTQVVIIIVVALLLLAAVLEAVHSLRERDVLVRTNRERSLTMAGSLQESFRAFTVLHSIYSENTSPLMSLPYLVDQFQEGFSRFAAESSNVAFEAIILPSGTAFIHSDPAQKGKTVAELGIQDVPLDRTVRRTIPGYGTVYLTRVEIDVSNFFAQAHMDFIIGLSAAPVDNELRTSIISSLLVAVLMVVLVSLVAVYMMQRGVVRPIRRVRAAARRFSANELDHRIDVSGSSELRELAQSLNQMAGSLQQSREAVDTLFHDVGIRVRSHNRDLQIAAEIGRIATGLRDIDMLLQETVDQIRDRFESIYHAQIFLVDELGEYAVLVKSTGEVGKRLIALGHKLPVGSDSVIGRVTARGQTVMVSDTRLGDVPWQPNPLLPATHAEMALPLTIEGRVIGALDVQSAEPDVFTSEMVQVFGVLADQLAIAIQNARLLAESERRVREIDNLNRQLTRTAWRGFLTEERGGALPGYLYDQVRTMPLDDVLSARFPAHRAEASIQVRGETIGTLIAAGPEGAPLTEDDHLLIQAVADRVALAVENARLFNQTQRALAETERLYEAARTVSSTSDLTDIYQLVAEQLSMAAGAVDTIEILLSGPAPTLIQYLESVYIWQRSDPARSEITHERPRTLPLSYEADMSLDEPMVYTDVSRELSPDHPLYPRLTGLNARGAVIAPLKAGGQWFGVLACSGAYPGSFGAAFAGFATALADQLAIAIENRRLFEEAQAEARRARALAEAGQLASQIGGDYVSGLQYLFQVVAGPGDYDRWWFGLLRDNDTVMEKVTASDEIALEVVNVTADQNALAEAARIGEIVLVNDPNDHPVVGDQDPDVVRAWGKHIAMPVKIGGALAGVLFIGRDLEAHNLDERDIQLAATLASQVAVATQNQRLFAEAESQSQRLQTIVNTMPTGILVMDRQGNVILSNQNLRDLLGPDMRPGTDRPQPYPVVRSGTGEPYPAGEWLFSRVFDSGAPVVVDDMTVIHPAGYEIRVLAQAAPIQGPSGRITAVVGAFQDITELQELERALQDSLRETTLLYEASRSISRASNMSELLEVTLRQVNTLLPDRVFIFLQAGDDPNYPNIRLAASQPPGWSSESVPCDLKPLLRTESVIFNMPNGPAEIRPCLEQLGLGTLGSFPLIVQQHINGWVLVGFNEPDRLTTEQRRFMTTLADQAAVTIENQRLLTRTEAALQNTAMLYNASRAIADAQGPADILQALVNYAASEPLLYAGLYIILGSYEDPTRTMVELSASWGDKSAVDPAGTRYPPYRFAFWEQLARPDIICLNDLADVTDLHPEMKYLLAVLEAQAATLIPLQVGGRPIGIVLLAFSVPWQPTENQLQLYQSLADQAAILLENNRLYAHAQRRARQLTATAEIGRAVTSILQLDVLLPQVVNMIRETFEYDHAQVFLISPDGKHANLVASTGEAGRQLLAVRHNLPVGSQSVIGQVTETGKPVIALDTADALVVHRPNPYLPDTRSEMALPLLARGQIIGALDVQSNRPGVFTTEDVQALTPLADMVAIAISNARLFEISQEHAEEMAFLFNVTTAATTSADLDQSLEQAVETLRAMLHVTGASIFLPDKDGEYLIKGAKVGPSSPETRSSSVALDRGLIGWVARHAEAVIIGDISQDPRRLPVAGATTQSVVAVPLQTAGELVGVLVVESEKLNAFDKHDLRLLQTLSGSLAAIIQNQRLLREVQAANERLLEVDRLKTNFLAAMSHELRTPLNSIIGFSRVILKGIDGPLTETQEQDLTTIYDSGKHLLGLVNDILDQAKIEAGKMDLSFGYFKLPEVIRGVMSSAVGLTRDKPVELFSEIADDLPDAYGDEFRTRQILLNLVSNAAKFTNKGSITVSSFPVVEDGRQYIQVSVADTGIGISQKDMPLLFVAFQQVDNSLTRSVEGTGMGLPLAKSLTELQHGRIWVESEPGVGSTFSITIPVGPPDQPVESPGIADGEGVAEGAAAIAAVPDHAPAPPRKLALVVEKNLEIIGLYRHYLAREGYEVIGTVHAEKTIEMVIVYHPSVVLIDVDVADGGGWDILAALKQTLETADTPVIVSSMNPDTDRARQLGAAGYLPKPFSEDQLLEVVRQADSAANCQHILLVDDKPETVRLFREALEASGHYCVSQATTGQQALDIIQQPRPIDLVILDLRMPEVDGFEVLQMLRTHAHTADIPILVLTAEDVSQEERAVLQTVEVYRKDDLDEQHFLRQVETRLGGIQENE